MEDGRVQILAYTKYKEMIRLSGKAYAVAENEQRKWMDIIFEEQPYLANVYPGDIYSGKCKRKGILHNGILYRLREMYETLSTEMY